MTVTGRAPRRRLRRRHFFPTYRGDFARWHIKAGVHKYQTVWSNQFAVYQKSEGSEGVAQVLTTTIPMTANSVRGSGITRSELEVIRALPKIRYDYRWRNFQRT